MSSLIFYTDETQVVVATDTLAVDSNGEPFMLTSKSTHIPHLNLVIAGTGCGGFSNEWAMHVNNRMVLGGIMNLDYHTQNSLLELWNKYKGDFALPEEMTTTVYHFGISEETKKIVSFAYRSTNEFRSEAIQYGTAVKPECKILEGNLIEIIPLMMQEQREIQESQPKESRIYIGGEINVMHLTENACNTFKIGEFPDFRQHRQFVLLRHSEK